MNVHDKKGGHNDSSVAISCNVVQNNDCKNMGFRSQCQSVHPVVDSQGQSQDCPSPVQGNSKTSHPSITSRFFYNSALNKKTWEGLFARGNKKKQLTNFNKRQQVYSRVYTKKPIHNGQYNNDPHIPLNNTPIHLSQGARIIH